MNWAYFIYGMIAWQLGRMVYQALDQELRERRERKFLKLVNVEFPDRSKITFITVDTSDRRAMAKLERQLREQFDLSEEDEDLFGDRSGIGRTLRAYPRRPPEDLFGDLEFDESVRRTDPHPRQDSSE